MFLVLAHLEGDGFLQHIKKELELQQRCSVSRVGGQCEEAVLFAPGQQVLLKQSGELLQAGGCQGQRAAAIQHQVTWRMEEKIRVFGTFSNPKKSACFILGPK